MVFTEISDFSLCHYILVTHKYKLFFHFQSWEFSCAYPAFKGNGINSLKNQFSSMSTNPLHYLPLASRGRCSNALSSQRQPHSFWHVGEVKKWVQILLHIYLAFYFLGQMSDIGSFPTRFKRFLPIKILAFACFGSNILDYLTVVERWFKDDSLCILNMLKGCQLENFVILCPFNLGRAKALNIYIKHWKTV